MGVVLKAAVCLGKETVALKHGTKSMAGDYAAQSAKWICLS
jgi:hypothetical protein